MPLPFPGHALAFIVVVADAEVLLEVFLRVLEVVLRLCRKHASDTIRSVRRVGYQLHVQIMMLQMEQDAHLQRAYLEVAQQDFQGRASDFDAHQRDASYDVGIKASLHYVMAVTRNKGCGSVNVP